MSLPPDTGHRPALNRTLKPMLLGMSAALVLLPPVLWLCFAWWTSQAAGSTAAPANDPTTGLWARTALVAMVSTGLAAALWWFKFRVLLQALLDAEVQVLTQGRHDPLTGLLNRQGLHLTLQRALRTRGGGAPTVSVVMVDLDRFHLINDSMGQPAGDEVLRIAAERIRAVVHGQDVLARVSADRFVIVIRGATGARALDTMTRNLLRTFEPACRVGSRDMVLTPSIGSATTTAALRAFDELMKCAELALRAAKAHGGGGWRHFEASLLEQHDLWLDLEHRLRRTAHSGGFAVAFQPIMDSRGVQIVAVEALLRWPEPGRAQQVSPAQFVPILEQTGLIVPVGRWIMQEACRQGLRWLSQGAHGLVLSVNVSPRQFADANFARVVAEVLAETGFPASRLQIEVTEGLLLDPSEDTMRKLNQLVRSGVQLAVDDFGIGQSSLAYLKNFPLHTLKIDRMFVRDLAEQPRDAAIARAIIELGHSLGLKVTAEGVETAAQAEILHRLGCDCLQGFLFSKPVSAVEFKKLLKLRGSPTGGDKPHGRWSDTMAGILDSVH